MRHRALLAAALACSLAAASACGARAVTPPASASPAVPAGRYAVPSEVGTLVVDARAFAAFAAAVRPDLERDTKAADPEVVKARLFVLAMLDALDGKWPSALALLERVAALESTREAKLMTGITLRAWAEAGGERAKFRDRLAARAALLPADRLMDQLAMLRTMGQVFTPDVCRQLVNEEVSPHVVDGTVGIEQVHAIVFQRYAVVYLVPVGKDIDAVMASLGVPALQPADGAQAPGP